MRTAAMEGDSLSREVRALCAGVAAELTGADTRDRICQIDEQLAEPLRVGVAGAVGSGKSTLINALLGQKAAPVRKGETEHVVTWYRYHHQERAELELVDGRRQTLALGPDGQAPIDLGVAPAEARRMTVWLSNSRLRELTIIDTPGGDTVTEVHQDAASAFLGENAAAATDADVLVFVMDRAGRSDEDTLHRFRELFRGTGLSAINAVGVLTKIDRMDGDPWSAAEPIVRRLSESFRSVLSQVVPVMGLLAETAQTAQLTESDAAAIARIAGLDDETTALATLAPEMFLEKVPDDVVPEPTFRRLLDMLDLRGIRVLIDATREGTRGAVGLRKHLHAASGIDRLTATLEQQFSLRADLLKSHAAIRALEHLAYLPGDPADRRVLLRLRDPLERLRFDARSEDLDVLQAAHRLNTDKTALPPDLAADLLALTTGRTARDRVCLPKTAPDSRVIDEVARAATRWGLYMNDVNRTMIQSRQAMVIKGAYERLYAAVTASS